MFPDCFHMNYLIPSVVCVGRDEASSHHTPESEHQKDQSQRRRASTEHLSGRLSHLQLSFYSFHSFHNKGGSIKASHSREQNSSEDSADSSNKVTNIGKHNRDAGSVPCANVPIPRRLARSHGYAGSAQTRKNQHNERDSFPFSKCNYLLRKMC